MCHTSMTEKFPVLGGIEGIESAPSDETIVSCVNFTQAPLDVRGKSELHACDTTSTFIMVLPRDN